jgi:hypothetical protein
MWCTFFHEDTHALDHLSSALKLGHVIRSRYHCEPSHL